MESVCHRCSLVPGVLTQLHGEQQPELEQDEDDSSRKVKLMPKRYDSRGGRWWGREAACVEGFDLKGLDDSCPWNEVKPPTTFFCHISS